MIVKSLFHAAGRLKGSGAMLLICTVVPALAALSCISATPPATVITLPGENLQAESAPSNAGDLPAPEQGWETVAVLSAGEETDRAFHIAAPGWRIRWALEGCRQDYSRIDVLIYLTGLDDLPIEHLTGSGEEPYRTAYIEQGNANFRIKVAAANMSGWMLAVEQPIYGGSSHPVQISQINFRGHVHEDSTEEAPVPEADEFVEITNFGLEPIPLRGWKLTNITRGNPVFIFPSYFPCNCEGMELEECIEEGFPPLPCVLEPFHSVRVYTFYQDPDSGCLSFNFAPGDIWNNETPDTAVLYSSSGKEVSRRSYRVYPDDYHSIEKPPVATSG